MRKRVDAAGVSLAEIEAVYRRRLPVFRRVAAAIVRDRAVAEDVVQEAFASAVRERAAFRREAPLEAWLFRIVINRARSEARRRAEQAYGSSGAWLGNGSAEAPVESGFAAALARLPERQRLALFLRYYADLDYTEIARVLHMAPGTVGSTLNAGRAALRRQLQEVKR